jgi:hypothetical protein
MSGVTGKELSITWVVDPADCADFERMTSMNIQGSQTIIPYSQNSPIAQVKFQHCTVGSSSNIRLMKSYICDGDSIIANDAGVCHYDTHPILCSVMSSNAPIVFLLNVRRAIPGSSTHSKRADYL